MNRLGQRYPQTIEFDLDPVRMARIILASALILEFGLLLADFALRSDLIRLPGDTTGYLFDMARKNSIAAGFARTQNLLAGLTCGLLALGIRHNSGITREVIGWITAGVFFAYRAVLPGMQTRENARWFESGANATDLFASLSSMQTGLLLLYVLLGFFSMIFLWNTLEEQRARIHLGAAIGCIFVATALAVLAGLSPKHPWNILIPIGGLAGPYFPDAWTRGETPIAFLQRYFRLTAFSLEMAATTLVWCLAIRHLAATVSSLRFRFAVH